jgi:hypothetical protein
MDIFSDEFIAEFLALCAKHGLTKTVVVSPIIVEGKNGDNLLYDWQAAGPIETAAVVRSGMLCAMKQYKEEFPERLKPYDVN